MVLYLHEALDHKLASGHQLTKAEIEAAAMEGAVQRLRPKLMTVTAVLASLIPILLESGIGSDVMRPIAAPIVGGMINLNNSRTDSGASVLCPYERTSTAAWHAAGGATETIRIDLSHVALNNIGRVHKPCWNGGKEWPASSRGVCTNIV